MSHEARFEGCEVLEQLRSGPATNWYLARQTAVGRTVVIKSLSPNVLPESPFAEPLEREARLLGKLKHERVIQLYDFVKRDQRMWLVREYVEGSTLHELLQQRQKLPITAALGIAVQIADALAYVHKKGVVHRDLQPKNVLVGNDGSAKVSNFFLAAETQSEAPPELLEGSSGFAEPNYMSPEQVLGEPPDPRSDLFSLGVILYEMLSGERPFDAPDRRTTAQRIRHEPPKPLQKDLGVPLGVERILLRALQKDPNDRFANAGEFALVLSQALDGQPPANAPQLVVNSLQTSSSKQAPKVKLIEPKKKEERGALGVALKGYIVLFLLLGSGVAGIQAAFGQEERTRPTKQPELALVPANAALFRAVVRPWADVYVDGQKVETTPFAHPLPLSPGVHYIRFEHPAAPPERRRIEVSPGQNVFLDVDMKLSIPDEPKPQLASPETRRPDAGDDSP